MINNNRTPMIQTRIPSATYRLQFNRQFNFMKAMGLVDYLSELGISDCYASPLLVARPGSQHGYDVTDHSLLNPELGTVEEFIELAGRLRERGMGLIMDVVPNHMCVACGSNHWWNDVLENGPSSPSARFFDIDWQPPKTDLANKVLLPMLGEQYGRVLENQELYLEYERGAFFVRYYETRLPLAPRSYKYILEPLLEKLEIEFAPSDHLLTELESIITALGYLPSRTETDEAKLIERQREKEVIKRRVDNLVGENKEVQRSLRGVLKELNGERGNPESFNRLECLLADQAYRLSYWRVAADEINYRRFFDINELAAIRIEEPEVFKSVHKLAFQLMKDGLVTGLRIDHVDGLLDPAQYLRDLQASCLDLLGEPLSAAVAANPYATSGSHQFSESHLPGYIVVEKILGNDELLRPDWDAYGTTGYGFLNLLNGVFIETAGKRAFQRLYERFTGQTPDFPDLVYQCKKLIMRVAMSSELHVLAHQLDRISEQHRYSRDFTLNSLQDALSEVIACFPIYRTYTRLDQIEVDEEDQRHIRRAIGEAKRRNPALSHSLFDFISSLLLIEDPQELNADQIAERRNFLLRFQQLTSPVMAKGLEDTAFYRYFPLASLNEVGGEPARFGITIDTFHRKNQQRMRERPHGLSATSTHDTKRSEDVRARLNVLSEIPAEWYRAILRWRNLNQDFKTQVEGTNAPDANDEYLIYQTLVGAWPFPPLTEDALLQFTRRIEEYAIKAIREAKIHSSWISPNEGYERSMRRFLRSVLEPSPENRFLTDFAGFQKTISQAGIFNALSQTLLKITSPGVPDFFQGTEIWNLKLVDPDNRGLVDYAVRLAILDEIREAEKGDLIKFVEHIMQRPEDGRIKMYLTRRALNFRRANHELFARGAYGPLRLTGSQKNQVIAFSRASSDQSVIVATGRFFTRLGVPRQLPVGPEVWEDTAIIMDRKIKSGIYRNILTGELLQAREEGTKQELQLSQVFSRLPVALLEQQ
jgi:(1->4)-alpha-D-glucan 1-alpha-D-glucosylmutase